MAEAFTGEVRLFPYTFAPRFWADCDGQLLPISQNTVLFSVISSTYGGDGRSTMAVPDLKTRAPMQWGSAPGMSYHPYGSFTGLPAVTLVEPQLPVHNHTLSGSNQNGTAASPAGNLFLGRDKSGRVGQNIKFTKDASAVSSMEAPMNSLSLAENGASVAHDNQQPYIGVRFCICLDGIYPARN